MALKDINFELQDNLDKADTYFPHLFVCKMCSKKYKVLGPQLDIHYRSHLGIKSGDITDTMDKERILEKERKREYNHNYYLHNKETINKRNLENWRKKRIMKNKIESKNKDITSRQPNALTQKEYDTIKDLLFRGETIKDIRIKTGKSENLIFRVKKSNNLQEYFTNSATYIREREKKKREDILAQKMTVPVQGEMGEIILWRAELDKILADFIARKVKEQCKPILEENERLEKELADLKININEDNFIEKLQQNLKNE